MVDQSAWSTKLKLLAFLIVVSLLPLLLLSLTSNHIMKTYEEEIAYDNVRDVSDSKASNLSSYFTGLRIILMSAVENNDVAAAISYDNYNAKQFLNGLLSSDKDITAIVIMDKDGNVSPSSVYNSASARVFTSFDSKKIFDDIKYSKGISSVSEYDGVEDRFLYSAYLTDQNGQITGYVSLVVGLSYLIDNLENSDFGNSTRMYILDPDKNILTTDGVKTVDDIKELASLDSAFDKAISDNLSEHYEYEYKDKNMVMQSVTVDNTKTTSETSWCIVTVSDIELLAGRYKDVLSSLHSSIFAICVVVFVFIVIFVSWFLRPIGNIMRILGTGKEINVSSQRVLVNGNSELDVMSRQINSMLDALSESEQRNKFIVDMTDNIVFEYSISKNTVTFSDNFNKKFSYRAASLKYEDSFLVNASVYPQDEKSYTDFVARVSEGHSIQGEFRFKTIYNDYIWYLVRSSSIRDSYNSIIKIVGVMIDIDKTKKREENLMQKASLDPLTQAYNRNSFELALLNEIELSQMRKGRDAILFIDLDDFKHFNDEYNHAVGDEVLVYTAKLAQKLVGKNGFVGRFGGDEFIICYRETDGCDALTLAQKIISGLGDGFESVNSFGHITMCCSIGIAYVTPADNDTAALMDKADQAMYSVKKRGKSNYAVYRDKQNGGYLMN